MNDRVNEPTVRYREGSNPPWLVTIRVHGRKKTKSFPSKKAATAHKNRLNRARLNGDEFDSATGQPVSWGEHKDRGTVVDVAQRIIQREWSGLRPKSRQSLVEALAHAIAATSAKDRADTYTVAVRVLSGLDLDRRQLDLWRAVKQTSPSAASVDYNAVLPTLAKSLDGKAAAPATSRRWKGALGRIIEEATGVRPQAPRKARGTRNKVAEVISPARIGTVKEALRIIRKVKSPGMRLLLQLMLYAGPRPSEALALSWQYVNLEEGVLYVTENSPTVPCQYSDSGTRADVQPPKWRTDHASRRVPLVPELVEILRAARPRHDATGLVCRNRNGKQFATNDVSKAWSKPREKEGASWGDERLGIPYDLRHTHASIALSAGVPVKELAERLGHAPEELLRTYAAVVPRDEPRWTSVMAAALASDDSEPD